MLKINSKWWGEEDENGKWQDEPFLMAECPDGRYLIEIYDENSPGGMEWTRTYDLIKENGNWKNIMTRQRLTPDEVNEIEFELNNQC